nr:molybdopterin converting factor subunit 1 [Chitinivorax tropicus]
MWVRILYFARLREVFGCGEERLALPSSAATVADLLSLLRSRGDRWADELAEGRTFRVAVAQEMAQLSTPLTDEVEVAIFPPVTGG